MPASRRAYVSLFRKVQAWLSFFEYGNDQSHATGNNDPGYRHSAKIDESELPDGFMEEFPEPSWQEVFHGYGVCDLRFLG